MSKYTVLTKDVTKIKTKKILNLTNRQLVVFSITGFISFIVYYAFNKLIGIEAVYIMGLVAFPILVLGLIEIDGLTVEKHFYNYIYRINNSPKRLYRIDNRFDLKKLHCLKTSVQVEQKSLNRKEKQNE